MINKNNIVTYNNMIKFINYHILNTINSQTKTNSQIIMQVYNSLKREENLNPTTLLKPVELEKLTTNQENCYNPNHKIVKLITNIKWNCLNPIKKIIISYKTFTQTYTDQILLKYNITKKKIGLATIKTVAN